jgi:hypothetical protein
MNQLFQVEQSEKTSDDYLTPRWVVDRFIFHRNGIALLPYVKAFWRLAIWESDAAIGELRNTDRLLFGREGKPTEIMFPTFFAAFGDECVEALSHLGRVR